ncbi:MAG: MerR family transcriptional regulator [Campylobacterota bacterium]
MSLKMSQLTKLTETPKSTILYYVKEGLLPQPQKPKPNQHLYDERCVDMIQFIKYLQKHFDSSIQEIKAIVAHDGFDFSKGFETLLQTINVIMGAAHQETYTASQLCERFNITPERLKTYIEKEYLYIRDGHFTQREVQILEILCEGEEQGMSMKIIESYLEHAKALAELEIALGKELLNSTQKTNSVVKSFFDTTLILKPYLFNMQTLQSYQRQKQS